MDREFQKTDKKLRKPEYLFGEQQGKFIELLVKDNLVKLLKEKSIDLQTEPTNVQKKRVEFDILAMNGCGCCGS
jgi:hypothetical protein